MKRLFRSSVLFTVSGVFLMVMAGFGLFRNPEAVGQAPGKVTELQVVPADAAIFAHVDFATLWNSPFGETFRKHPIKGLDEVLKTSADDYGLKLDMIQSMTMFWPELKQPDDFNSFAVLVTLSKPLDRERVVTNLRTLLKDAEKVELEDRGGIVSFTLGLSKVQIVTDDQHKRLWVMSNLDPQTLQARPASETGPLSTAIRQAKDNTLTLAVNWASMPEELRRDDLPVEYRPFQPLFKSDAVVLTGKLTPNATKLQLRAESTERFKVQEAEKSLGAGVQLLRALVDSGLDVLTKDQEMKAMVPALQTIKLMLNNATTELQDKSATVSAELSNEFAYGPIVQQVFGGEMSGRAARSQTANNLKQIGLALHNYHDVNGGFPPQALCDKRGKPLLSWRVLILPYIEQQALYNQFRLDEPWDSEHNKKLSEIAVKVFECPELNKGDYHDCHFRVFYGQGAMFDAILPSKIQGITDGTSNTGMVFLTAKGVPWTKPDDEAFNPKTDDFKKLFAWPNDLTPVLFGDGSVRSLRKSIDAKVLKAVITKNGGEVITID